jgi:hypothetical protein
VLNIKEAALLMADHTQLMASRHSSNNYHADPPPTMHYLTYQSPSLLHTLDHATTCHSLQHRVIYPC